jgi:LAO/AO transport system kinase
MATRGSLGGLSATTGVVADTLDAFGFDRVIIETVGVGQSELDIAATADTTVVALVPESGDSIQAMKAGLMEIADLFVVNKADRPGAARLAREIELMLHLRHGNTLRHVPAHHGVHTARAAAAPAPANTPGWPIPVLLTIAETGDGVPRLVETLEQHLSWLADSGELSRRRRARLADRVRDAVARSLARMVWHELGGEELLAGSLDGMEAGTLTPYEVAARIVRAVAG